MEPPPAMIALIFICISVASANPVTQANCIEDCECQNGTMYCNYKDLESIPIPIAAPMYNIKFIAVVCNNIEVLPHLALLRASYPDLIGLDVIGNPIKDCSSLDQYKGKILYDSECGKAKQQHCPTPEINVVEATSEVIATAVKTKDVRQIIQTMNKYKLFNSKAKFRFF